MSFTDTFRRRYPAADIDPKGILRDPIGLVASVIRRYHFQNLSRFPVPYEEMIHEGVTALLIALPQVEPREGAVSYCWNAV